MTDLAQLDATAQADLVRRGELTPRELVEAAIARIERHDGELGALVHRTFDKARAAADVAPAGPFRGVPTVIKDLGPFTSGDPFHGGMKLLADRQFTAPLDSAQITRLRAAGFAIVGKTRTPEMGFLPTSEPLAFGPARNPYDLGRSTGGSSGGSAGAVAAGLVPIAHGNDGGGSIRIPAACCGLVGLKPTRDRVSFAPLLGDINGGLVVEGGLARSVRDAAAWLDVVAGPELGDPRMLAPPARPYREEVGAPPGRLKIGFATRAMTPGGKVEEAHPDCVAGVKATAALLAELGHEVEEAPIPALETPEYYDRFMTIWRAGASAGVQSWGELFRFEPSAADVEPLTWRLYQEGKQVSAADYLIAWRWLHLNGRMVAHWFTGRDLYLSPTCAQPPPLLGYFDAADPATALARAATYAAFTAPFNATGQPAISLPLHRTAAGLPVGIQLVAGFGREDLLLRIAAQLEAARPFTHPATRR
jgi:amidase